MILTLEDGGTVAAHRCILCARSHRSLKEALESPSIKSYQLDGNPALVRELIKFWYSGMPPEDIESIALELFPVAHKYEESELVQMCALACRRILSEENVVDILIISDVYKPRGLFKYCVPFYKANVLGINADHKKKLISYPELLLKLADALAQ